MDYYKKLNAIDILLVLRSVDVLQLPGSHVKHVGIGKYLGLYKEVLASKPADHVDRLIKDMLLRYKL